MTSKSTVTLTFTGKDDQLRKTFASVEKSAGGLQSKFATVGKAAAIGGAAIAAGAVIGGKALLDLGSNFDAARDTIIKGTGATGDALKGLEQSFDNVLASGPNSFEDTAAAIADLNTALGLTGKPLEDLSKQFLDLSRVTGEDVGGQIQSVTRLFGDWGVAVDDQALAMDKLFAISQATGIGVSDLSDQLVRSGAPLRQLGFSMEESAAIMGKWNKEGVNSEIIFSGVRMAIGRMAKSGKDVPTAFADAQKAIMEAGSASEATAIAIETFGQRAGPDMAAAIREGRFEIADLVSSLEGVEGTIDKTARETESFSEKWQTFKNQMAVALKPAAMAVFDALGKAMDKIGPVLNNTIIPAVREFFNALSSGMTEDEGTTIERIALGVRDAAKIIGKAAKAVMGFIRGTLIPAVQQGAEFIRRVWGKIGPDVRKIFNQVMDVVKVAMVFIRQAITSTTAAVTAIWDRWGSTITAVAKIAWNLIKGVISGGLTIIKGLFMTATALMRGDWSAAWAGIRTILSGALAIIKAVIRAGFAVITGLTRSAWTGIKSWIGRSVDGAKDWVRRAINSIISFFAGIPRRVARALSGLASAVTKPFRDAYNGATRWLNKIPGVGSVRSVASSIRRRIPFFHDGGVFRAPPGRREGPAMLEDGESVLTPGQMAALGRGAGGGRSAPVVELHINAGNSELDRVLVAVLRKAVQNRGGNVQAVIGAG